MVNTEDSMVRKRKAQNGDTVNVRDERGIGEDIINNTSTPTMRPTSEEL